MRTNMTELEILVHHIGVVTGKFYEISCMPEGKRLVEMATMRELSPRLPAKQFKMWLEAYFSGLYEGEQIGQRRGYDMGYARCQSDLNPNCK